MSSPANITNEQSAEELAFVSLGSNLPSKYGSPEKTLKQAIQMLKQFSDGPLKVSSIHRTAPKNCPPDTPDFFNAIVSFQPRPELNGPALLRELLKIESEFERKRGYLRNLPRTLDLDLICYGGRQSQDDFLVLPHPRAHQRRFVLEPLAEIAPKLVLPGQSVTVQELLDQFGD